MTGSLAGEVGRRLRQCSSLGIQGALEAVEPEADAYLKRIRVALDAAGASEEVRRRVRALWIASVAMYREPLGSPLRDALAEIRRDREMEPMDLLADEGFRRFIRESSPWLSEQMQDPAFCQALQGTAAGGEGGARW